MGDKSAISWTNATCSEAVFQVHLVKHVLLEQYSPLASPVLQLSIPFRTVARGTRGQDIPWHSRTPLGDRYYVIPGCGGGAVTVGAQALKLIHEHVLAFRGHFVNATLAGVRMLSSFGPIDSIRGVPFSISLAGMHSTQPRVDGCERQPRPAITTPALTCNPPPSPFRDRRASPRNWWLAVGACCFQAIMAAFISRIEIHRSPVTASPAPLLPVRNLGHVVINTQPTASSRRKPRAFFRLCHANLPSILSI